MPGVARSSLDEADGPIPPERCRGSRAAASAARPPERSGPSGEPTQTHTGPQIGESAAPDPSDVALSSCPSWARTRTLLIQSQEGNEPTTVKMPAFEGEPGVRADSPKRAAGIWREQLTPRLTPVIHDGSAEGAPVRHRALHLGMGNESPGVRPRSRTLPVSQLGRRASVRSPPPGPPGRAHAHAVSPAFAATTAPESRAP
jgi:hypothetical protein